MNVIINNGITKEYMLVDRIDSDFIIKSFNYTPKN